MPEFVFNVRCYIYYSIPGGHYHPFTDKPVPILTLFLEGLSLLQSFRRWFDHQILRKEGGSISPPLDDLADNRRTDV